MFLKKNLYTPQDLSSEKIIFISSKENQQQKSISEESLKENHLQSVFNSLEETEDFLLLDAKDRKFLQDLFFKDIKVYEIIPENLYDTDSSGLGATFNFNQLIAQLERKYIKFSFEKRALMFTKKKISYIQPQNFETNESEDSDDFF